MCVVNEKGLKKGRSTQLPQRKYVYITSEFNFFYQKYFILTCIYNEK